MANTLPFLHFLGTSCSELPVRITQILASYQCRGLADTFAPCPDIPLQTFLNTIIIWFIVVFFRPKQLFLQFEFQPCLFLFTSLQIPITQRRLLAPYIANKHIFTWCRSRPEFLLETASKEEPVPHLSPAVWRHHQRCFFPATTLEKQIEMKMIFQSQKVKSQLFKVPG